MSKEDPRALRRSQWLGDNLLGEILTEVRDELMGGSATTSSGNKRNVTTSSEFQNGDQRKKKRKGCT